MKKDIITCILSTLIAFILIPPPPIYADTTNEPGDILNEYASDADQVFIEHDYFTNTDTTFTMDDVISATPAISSHNALNENGCFYTQPYNLPEQTGDFSTSDSTIGIQALLPGRPYEYVSNVNASPYSKTVLIYLYFEQDDGSIIRSSGTGFMIGDKVILTAGHVIWHTQLRRSPKEIRVFLKFDKSKTSLSQMDSETNYYHPKSWVYSSNFATTTGNLDYNYDWCYLTMFSSIGKTYTGWYGIATTAGSITDKVINVTGYPDQNGEQFHQYKSNGILNSTSDYRVSHTCSTKGGHSGAPLYSNGYVVWAIHTASGGTTYNTGVRITPTLYKLLTNKIESTN